MNFESQAHRDKTMYDKSYLCWKHCEYNINQLLEPSAILFLMNVEREVDFDEVQNPQSNKSTKKLY